MNTDNKTLRQVTLNGMLTVGTLENGRNALDFACCEYVELAPFTAQCKVQVMRDGNVYMTEKAKRVRNRPLFRDDNCSLSLGHDGRYYFVFSLPAELVDELPDELVRQALAIAQKVNALIINTEETR